MPARRLAPLGHLLGRRQVLDRALQHALGLERAIRSSYASMPPGDDRRPPARGSAPAGSCRRARGARRRRRPPAAARRAACASGRRAARRVPSRIFRLTSWSEQSTPAELSTASVLMRPPACAYSMRPRCVKPRLPPSPTTRARRSPPLTRMASFVRSPTSALDSSDALTNVPMPPFQNRSTAARAGSPAAARSAAGCVGRRRRARARASGDERDRLLASRDQTPPPGEISDAVVVVPRRRRQVEQALALGEGRAPGRGRGR